MPRQSYSKEPKYLHGIHTMSVRHQTFIVSEWQALMLTEGTRDGVHASQKSDEAVDSPEASRCCSISSTSEPNICFKHPFQDEMVGMLT